VELKCVASQNEVLGICGIVNHQILEMHRDTAKGSQNNHEATAR